MTPYDPIQAQADYERLKAMERQREIQGINPAVNVAGISPISPQQAEAAYKALQATKGQISNAKTGITEFAPSPNWKPYERNFDNTVVSYLDQNNKIYYAPANVMYKLGYRTGGTLKKNGTVEHTDEDSLRFGRGWTSGSKAGVTLGKYTLTKSQAAVLKDLSAREDWEGVFSYQKKLGLIEPGRLSPNEQYRLESKMRQYSTGNGDGYLLANLIKDIAEGRTDISYNDIAKFFGKEMGNRVRTMVKTYKTSNKAKAAIDAALSLPYTTKLQPGALTRKWERDTLPKLPVYVQNAYREAKRSGDYSKFEKEFHKYQGTIGYAGLAIKAINDQNQKQKAALKELNEYKGQTLTGFNPYARQEIYSDTYDIARYLRDNQDKDKVLKTAGFTAKDIKTAREFNIEYNKPMPADQFIQRYYSEQKGWNYTDDKGSIDAWNAHSRDNTGALSTKSGRALFDRATEAIKRMKEAGAAYSDKYGKGAAVQSLTGIVAGMAFAPARAIEPGVGIKDISGMEWTIGGAQIAMYSMPFLGAGRVGTVLRTGISAGAGGLFTYETASQWNTLSPAEKALSVVMDSLILLPAASSFARYARGKIDPLGVKADKFIKSLDANNKAMANRIRENYGSQPAEALLERNNAQADYVRELVKEQRGKKADIEAAAQKLETAERKYSTELLKKIGDDLPGEELKDAVKRLPDEIRRTTNQAFEKAIATRDNLRILENQRTRAKQELERIVRTSEADFQKYRASMPKTNEAQFKIAERWKTYQGKIDAAQVKFMLADTRFKMASNSNIVKTRASVEDITRRIKELKEKPGKTVKARMTAQKQIQRLENQKLEYIKQLKELEKYVHPEAGGGESGISDLAGNSRVKTGYRFANGKYWREAGTGEKFGWMDKKTGKRYVEVAENEATERIGTNLKSGTSGGGGGKVDTMIKPRERVGGSLATELRQKGRVIGGKIAAGGGVRASAKAKTNIETTPAFSTQKIIESTPGRGEMPTIAPMTNTDVNERIREVTKGQELNKTEVQSITEAVNKTLSESRIENLSKQDIQSRIDSTIRENIKQNIEPSAKSEPAPQTQPLNKLQTKTEVKIKTPEPERPKKEPLKLPGGGNKQDQDKRAEIRNAQAAATYRRGKLRASIWHTLIVDKSGNIKVIVVEGSAPIGAKIATGPGSARQSLQKLYGKKLPNFSVREKTTGAVDTVLSSTGGQLDINFIQHKGGAISEPKGRISGGYPRLSSGIGRISPRMPKLR